MRFALRDHRGQGKPFMDAMHDALHIRDPDPDVVLIDYDLPHPAYQDWVDRARDKTLVIYPHGASFFMGHDLAGDPIPTDLTLVLGEGQKALLEAYDYPNPVEAIGWPWGGRGHTRGPRTLRRVLFAPLHPLGSGYLREDLAELNREAYELLLDEGVQLTVRHLGPLSQSGLKHRAGVRYIEGQPGTLDGIEDADVVVASQTFAAKALVAGWPVVMFATEREWRLESEHNLDCTWAEDWESYALANAYPYTLAPSACQEASENPNVQAWKDRFIGPDWDPEAFTRLIEETVCSRTLT